MEQRITLVTLGVDDLAEARTFFEDGLGWRRANVPSDEVAFYQCGCIALGLFGRRDLAEDAGLVDDGSAVSATGFVPVSIAWNGRSEDEVDAAFDRALAGGATALKRPVRASWGGYSGYVRIPGSQHLLELAYNPGFPLDPDGAVTLPLTRSASRNFMVALYDALGA